MALNALDPSGGIAGLVGKLANLVGHAVKDSLKQLKMPEGTNIAAAAREAMTSAPHVDTPAVPAPPAPPSPPPEKS